MSLDNILRRIGVRKLKRFPFLMKFPFSKLTGYGRLSRAFYNGMKIVGGVPHIAPGHDFIPEHTEKELIDLNNNSDKNQEIGMVIDYASEVSLLSNKYRISYSMYETTDIPEKWKEHVAKADEIFVPSTFCADIFSKYNDNIKVVHPGIYDNIFKPLKNRKENDVFGVGISGVMSERKGIDVLIRAFQLAFENKKDVRLVVKSRDTRWMPRIVDEKIIYKDEDWDDERLAFFYGSMDLMVYPARGEGIGLCQLEAASCGTPVLTTKWSGCTDYIDEKNVFGIDITGLVTVKSGSMMGENTQWAEPSLSDLIDKLQHFYYNRKRIKFDNSYWAMESAAKRLIGALNI